MLNVMTWVRGTGKEGRGGHYKQTDDASHEVTLNYLRAQVENALHVGWHRRDIRLYTNFPFEHMGVIAIKHKLVFEGNSFHNKWTAVKQCISSYAKPPDLFFHDLDAFQTEWLDFPSDIHGNPIHGIGMATSHNERSRWNAGVAFLKGDAIRGLLRRYFVASARRKRITNDEHVWDEVSRNRRLKGLFSVLPRKYNLAEGQHWRDELRETGGEIKILHIKPNQLFRPWHWYWEGERRRTMSWRLTPPRLHDLFVRHNIYHPDNDKDFTDEKLQVDEGTGDGPTDQKTN